MIPVRSIASMIYVGARLRMCFSWLPSSQQACQHRFTIQWNQEHNWGWSRHTLNTHMCIHIYICTYVCIRLYIKYIHIHIHIYINIIKYVYLHTWHDMTWHDITLRYVTLHSHLHSHLHLHYMYVCMYVRTYVCIYVCKLYFDILYIYIQLPIDVIKCPHGFSDPPWICSQAARCASNHLRGRVAKSVVVAAQYRDGHTPDKLFTDFQDPPKWCFVNAWEINKVASVLKHLNHPNQSKSNIRKYPWVIKR